MPSEQPYGVIAFYTVAYDKEVDIEVPFAMPIATYSVWVPDGIKVKSDQLSDQGQQQADSGTGATFQVYSGSGLNAGDTLAMNISGKVKDSVTGETPDSHQAILIGAGAFGLVLVLAGAWMFIRDRNREDEYYDEDEDEDEEEDEFETADEVMDAIIALDDLHRAKKIPDEAYQQRRAELKEQLKKLA